MTLGPCVQSTVVDIIFNPAYVASNTRGFQGRKSPSGNLSFPYKDITVTKHQIVEFLSIQKSPKSILQYFCYYSHFYRKLIRGSGASPTEAVVRTWLKAIHEKTGVLIAYTEDVHFALVNRAVFVKSKTKKLASSGGRQMRRFLQSGILLFQH